MTAGWNPWHGCKKISTGCMNCYVYRMDARHEKNAGEVKKTAAFDLPVKKDRHGNYKIPSGTLVYTCFTSDFFLDAADEWRAEAWDFIRKRPDLHFFMITKRIDRFMDSIPPDWGSGWGNVTICCTVENQEMADYRLPIYIRAPIAHKMIAAAPLLSPIDLSPYLGGWVEQVAVGGESGENARLCDFDWVLGIRNQCVERDIPFFFQQTGALFKKDGRVYRIKRRFQHSQARKAGINYRT